MSEEELEAFLAKVAPEYRYRGDRFLRPSVDAVGAEPPSPLMTWWLLLYSFSILARYEPRRWLKLLDQDSSKVAVLLRYALEEALTALPSSSSKRSIRSPTCSRSRYPSNRLSGRRRGSACGRW